MDITYEVLSGQRVQVWLESDSDPEALARRANEKLSEIVAAGGDVLEITPQVAAEDGNRWHALLIVYCVSE